MNLRQKILTKIYENGEAHIGSCFSCVEIIEVLYEIMQPTDKFILSKSHARRVVDCLGYHPAFVEEVCPYGGSLGNGVGIGIGMAIANPKSMVYVVCGDGETDEGSFREALNYMKVSGVKNITVIIDCNYFSATRRLDYVSFIDGHDKMAIKGSLAAINYNHMTYPFKTTKGKGIKDLENKLESHYIKPTAKQYKKWMKELCEKK